MKNVSILFISILVCFASCKTTKPGRATAQEISGTSSAVTTAAPAQTDFSEQSTWLLGYFNPAQLSGEPYSSWYIKGFDDYQLNTEALNKLLDINTNGITIKIVMGTWCPDSRREVPRFMRILDAWKFSLANVTFIGVDDAKKSPVAEYGSLNIQRVPTFIIYKNNIEAGRIIENPKTSLEQDMVNILTGNE